MQLLTYKYANLELLDITLLSDYLLTEVDAANLNNITANITKTLADMSSYVQTKMGPNAASKQSADALYVKQQNTLGLTSDDLSKLKYFVMHELVGYDMIAPTNNNFFEKLASDATNVIDEE